MKKTVFILLVILISTTTTTAYSNNGNGFNVFYSSLEPHGEWIEIEYDLYAWQPYNVRYDWKPYSDGRWEWTRNGWYWVSNEPFGWATYHYGRWYYDDYYGWLWLPDTEWGPSWVEWRYNNNYIGWAPLPPYASFSRHSGIHFSTKWNSGYYHWNFVNYHNFRSNRINVHIVNNYRRYNIFNDTKYRTNYYHRDGRIVNGGVNRNFVERKGGYKIRERNIETTSDVQTYRTRSKDNSRDRVISYKPRISENKKNRTAERKNVRRGNVNSSLKKDRIALERKDSKKRSTKIFAKSDSPRSDEKKNIKSKSKVGNDISKRTYSYGEKSKEKTLEVRTRSKQSNTANKKGAAVRKSSESRPAKKVVQTKADTKPKKVKTIRTVDKKDNSEKKKRTLKQSGRSTTTKRLNN